MSDLLSQLGQALAGKYEIDRESGNRSSERGDAQITDYDVSPSGQLAVFGVAATGRAEVVLELNWAANVRQR